MIHFFKKQKSPQEQQKKNPQPLLFVVATQSHDLSFISLLLAVLIENDAPTCLVQEMVKANIVIDSE